MNVLFLSYDGLTDPLGQSQVLPYLAQLAARGYHIIVLSLEKEKNLPAAEAAVRETCRSSGIRWHYQMFCSSRGITEKAGIFRSFNREALRLALEYRVRLVHCRSYPAAVAAMRIGRRLSIPWIFDIRGFWLDERREGAIWNFRNPLTWLIYLSFRLLEKKMYRDAAAVVTLSASSASLVRRRFIPTGLSKPLVTIPCAADHKLFRPAGSAARLEIRDRLGIPREAGVLLYTGSSGSWYMPGEMLDFFRKLREVRPSCLFFIATHDDPSLFLSLAASRGIPRDALVIRKMPYREMPDVYAMADWGIALIRPLPSKRASSPVKWAEMLASGLPLVTNVGIGDIEELAASLPGVHYLKEFTENEYISLAGEWTRSSYDRRQISASSRNHFDLSRAVGSYEEIYRSCTGKQVLVIASHRPGRAPNQRFRVEQYFSRFAEEGFHCHLHYLVGPKEDAFIYRPGKVWRKAWFFLVTCRVRRQRTLAMLNRFDLVILVREALMTRSVSVEKQIAKAGIPVIYDFDDAIWMANVSEANTLFRRLKNPAKVRRLIRMADRVVAGNDFLAEYARRFHSRVTIIPTTVDTEAFVPQEHRPGKKTIVIGWTGSLTTVAHFRHIEPALTEIRKKYGDLVSFTVYGEAGYRNEQLGIRGIPWSLGTEKEILRTFDIGIMPLPDNDWTRGKCGFKGLLCMAMGIPVVMSPVGVNKRIIEDGVNGFLAGPAEEWTGKLGRLIESEELRRQLGHRGRMTVEKEYSVKTWTAAYLGIFRELTDPHVTQQPDH